jgi:hypothetical protein
MVICDAFKVAAIVLLGMPGYQAWPRHKGRCAMSLTWDARLPTVSGAGPSYRRARHPRSHGVSRCPGLRMWFPARRAEMVACSSLECSSAAR